MAALGSSPDFVGRRAELDLLERALEPIRTGTAAAFIDHLDRLRDPERVGSWLASTARHESIRVSRQLRRSLPTSDADVFDRGAGAGADDDPARALLRREHDAALRRLVADLPARDEDLLGLLTADPPVSYAEVATDLGIAVGSIGPTRQRCLRSLRAKAVVVGIVDAYA